MSQPAVNCVIDLTDSPAPLVPLPSAEPDANALRQEILDTLHEFACDKRSMAPATRRQAGSRAGYYVAAGRRAPRTNASLRRSQPVGTVGTVGTAVLPARRSSTRWEAAQQIALALGSRR